MSQRMSTARHLDNHPRVRSTTQRRAFEDWADTTPGERSLALLRLADRIEERAEELADLEAAPIDTLAAGIRQPTLIVRPALGTLGPDRGQVLTAAEAERWRARIPHSQVVVVPETNHYSILLSGVLVETVAAFLAPDSDMQRSSSRRARASSREGTGAAGRAATGDYLRRPAGVAHPRPRVR